jgi:hypothetical protein
MPREALGPLALKTAFPDDPSGRPCARRSSSPALDRTLPIVHIALNGLDGDKHHSVDTHWDH